MIDLHMHTLHSDGSDSVEKLLTKVSQKGLNTISITDHNTVDAYFALEKINVKDYYDGKIIIGIELNTKVLGIPIEILGYGIDYNIMKNLLKEVYIPAEKRNRIEVQRLFEKCLKAGLKLDDNCLERYDPSMFASKFIHTEIRKYGENKNVIDLDTWDDTKTFYRKYMSNPEGPLYVEMDDFVPDFNTASDLVRKAGGLVFIPHIFEYRENSRRVLEYIEKNYKFDGIECYYTTFSNEQIEEILSFAKEHNLYISGGSDYHGKNKPGVDVGTGLGNLIITDEIIKPWENMVLKYNN